MQAMQPMEKTLAGVVEIREALVRLNLQLGILRSDYSKATWFQHQHDLEARHVFCQTVQQEVEPTLTRLKNLLNGVVVVNTFVEKMRSVNEAMDSVYQACINYQEAAVPIMPLVAQFEHDGVHQLARNFQNFCVTAGDMVKNSKDNPAAKEQCDILLDKFKQICRGLNDVLGDRWYNQRVHERKLETLEIAHSSCLYGLRDSVFIHEPLPDVHGLLCAHYLVMFDSKNRVHNFVAFSEQVVGLPYRSELGSCELELIQNALDFHERDGRRQELSELAKAWKFVLQHGPKFSRQCRESAWKVHARMVEIDKELDSLKPAFLTLGIGLSWMSKEKAVRWAKTFAKALAVLIVVAALVALAIFLYNYLVVFRYAAVARHCPHVGADVCNGRGSCSDGVRCECLPGWAPPGCLANTSGLGYGSISWQKVTREKRPLTGHTATLFDNSLVVFGGRVEGALLATVSVLHLDEMEWSEPKTQGRLPVPRSRHVAGKINSHTMLVCGGRQHNDRWAWTAYTVGSDCHELDTVTWKWAPLALEGARLPAAHGQTMVSLAGNSAEFWVFGGSNDTHFFNTLHVIDSAHKTVRVVTAARPPSPRSSHSAVALDAKRLAIFGGYDRMEEYPDLYIFHTVTSTWSRMEVGVGGRHGHVMLVAGPYLYIMGGNSGNKYLNEAYVARIEDGQMACKVASPTLPGSQRVGRAYMSGTVTPRGLLLYGGYDGKKPSSAVLVGLADLAIPEAQGHGG